MSVNRKDNRLSGAQNLGTVTRSRTLEDFVGRRDPVDHIQFRITSRGSVNIALSGLTADADMQLLNAKGELIVRSRRAGTLSESIRRELNAGRYYVRVNRFRGDTEYLLQVSASLEPGNQSLWGNYTGVATTTIEVSDMFGDFVGTTRTQVSTTVTIGRVKQVGTTTESNPFNLVITPSPGSRNLEGAIDFYSAVPFNLQGGVLAQYWSFQLSGSRLFGRLVNTFAAQSLESNFFNSRREVSPGFWTLQSYGMASGTQLGGTVTKTELRLRITGNSIDLSRPFTTDIVVRRADG